MLSCLLTIDLIIVQEAAYFEKSKKYKLFNLKVKKLFILLDLIKPPPKNFV